MNIKIEKDIPPPVNGASKKYPFHEMESGDSFWIEAGKAASARSAANTYLRANRNLNLKIVSREESNGFRLWLVSNKAA